MPLRVDIVAPGYLSFSHDSHLRRAIFGSEEAIIHVAPRLARLGYDVHVWPQLLDGLPGNYRGVSWHSPGDLNLDEDRAALILWRNATLLEPFSSSKGKKIVWLHDATITRPDLLVMADAVLVLSQAHRRALEGQLDERVSHQVRWRQIQNGIDPAAFGKVDESLRNSRRAVYLSQPDRGLLRLLRLWPLVQREVPDAELWIYGDASVIGTQAERIGQPALDRAGAITRERDRLLSDLAGVTYFGAVSHPELHKGLSRCGVWAYPLGPSKIETFCISAVKALASGLWPVTTDSGSLAEVTFAGTILPAETFSDADFARKVATAMLDPPSQKRREEIRTKALSLYDWDVAAKQIADEISR